MSHTHLTHLTSQLLQNGFALVPIPYGRKGPQTLGWNLRQNVTVNPTDANRLKGMNVGLAHAYCTPNPTCALDIDHYPGAKAWLTSHSIDLDALIRASGQVVIHSGKRHSLKLIYRLPAGQLPLESKKINGIDGKTAWDFAVPLKMGIRFKTCCRRAFTLMGSCTYGLATETHCNRHIFRSTYFRSGAC